MASVQDVLSAQKQIEESLLTKMAGFEKKLQSTTPDKVINLEKLSAEFTDFKQSVWSILSLLRSLIDSLTLKVDELDNQSRRNALLFNGVQEVHGENCTEIIRSIINSKMGLGEIQITSLQSCHRLGIKSDKTRPILVRFADIVSRNLVWREKKKLKASSIVLGEFLTKQKQNMFIAARKHFGITRCWTQSGQIIIKLPNDERKRISSPQELDAFINKFPSLTTTSEATAGSIVAHKASRSATSPAYTPAPGPQARNMRPAAVTAKSKLAK